ncbi:EamA family transporter [Winogradskyella maritima]|uniref:DMT family transporter n=1 Tax=Winogradskyella maritima TaxID=1517766 RepID=A0ABV8AFH5_9FLAO|nr:EamA family transporter [Winogradskyella maritima]
MKNLNPKLIYLILLSLVWGSSFILIKKSLLGLTAFQLGALRTVFAGIVLLFFGFTKLKGLSRKHWTWIFVSSLVGSFFPAFLFAIAQTEIDSAVTSILNSLVPLNTVLLGITFFKIGSSKRQILGVALGFIGCAILILKGAVINPNQNYLFAGFVIIATMMYATNANIIKRYLDDVKPLAIAAGHYAFITIPAIIILIFTDFFKSETMANPEFNWAVIYTLILAVFGTAMAKVFYNKLIQISNPVFASSVTYMMPVVALIWGLIDGENFTWLQGLGALIILSGVYLSNASKNKKTEA